MFADHPHWPTVKALLINSAAGRLPPEPDKDAPAVLLTTSGTTGAPKFVTHTPTTLSALANAFADTDLESAQIVLNGGGSMNFGGTSKHGDMTVNLVPAVHSTLAGYPSAGFILEIGGVRVYASGDTDLFGVGDGPYTMGPQDAARACQLMGVSQAVPVHYAHNPQVMGIQAGEEFRRAVAAIAPSVKVHVMKPGDGIQVTA